MASLRTRRRTRSGLSGEGCACQRILKGELREHTLKDGWPWLQCGQLDDWHEKGLGRAGGEGTGGQLSEGCEMSAVHAEPSEGL